MAETAVVDALISYGRVDRRRILKPGAFATYVVVPSGFPAAGISILNDKGMESFTRTQSAPAESTRFSRLHCLLDEVDRAESGRGGTTMQRSDTDAFIGCGTR